MADNTQQDAGRQAAEAVQASGRATSDTVRRGGRFAADTTRRVGEAGADAVNRTGRVGSENIRRGSPPPFTRALIGTDPDSEPSDSTMKSTNFLTLAGR